MSVEEDPVAAATLEVYEWQEWQLRAACGHWSETGAASLPVCQRVVPRRSAGARIIHMDGMEGMDGMGSMESPAALLVCPRHPQRMLLHECGTSTSSTSSKAR